MKRMAHMSQLNVLINRKFDSKGAAISRRFLATFAGKVKTTEWRFSPVIALLIGKSQTLSGRRSVQFETLPGDAFGWWESPFDPTVITSNIFTSAALSKASRGLKIGLTLAFNPSSQINQEKLIINGPFAKDNWLIRGPEVRTKSELEANYRWTYRRTKSELKAK